MAVKHKVSALVAHSHTRVIAANDADDTPCGHDPGRTNPSLEVLIRYSNYTIGKT